MDTENIEEPIAPLEEPVKAYVAEMTFPEDEVEHHKLYFQYTINEDGTTTFPFIKQSLTQLWGSSASLNTHQNMTKHQHYCIICHWTAAVESSVINNVCPYCLYPDDIKVCTEKVTAGEYFLQIGQTVWTVNIYKGNDEEVFFGKNNEFSSTWDELNLLNDSQNLQLVSKSRLTLFKDAID